MKCNFARYGAIDSNYVNGGANPVAIADLGERTFVLTQTIAMSEKRG